MSRGGWTRRRWLQACAAVSGGAIGSPWAATASASLAAAWQGRDGGANVGVLRLQGHRLQVHRSIAVPTRAHGLLQEPGGTLLAVARRPGDWLMRWDRDGRVLALAWIEPNRAYNGHLIADASGDTLYTSETDLDSGAGLIGVRDARTLDKRAEWPTHGRDPHMLLWDEHAAPFTRLVVANGGIEIRPETGRMKLGLDRMDSSLVRIDAAQGDLQGRWQVDDARLSLRHLAWHGHGSNAVLGIAMQAEHGDATLRSAAPVLARFDGRALQPAASPALAGYGGDITADDDGFVIGCPRAQGLARWQADGQWQGLMPLREACAVALDASRALWAAGRSEAQRSATKVSDAKKDDRSQVGLPIGLQLDNHWLVLRDVAAKEG
ncbi:DUF1513 domain-containing protein [Rhizobacter sp. OV335]|uniref:DUF1513 domain-containing protein n=1 Tax=Rhizobacter sp. OV335 TaxID=1500264 RepID=UPI00092152DE|nr:DUF1513 domain-containing protein [Rhizobacter sp. OV335]SHN37207.1 hypothetical protein SAMN02787076_05685 [Rhizobacter sp. OV335]